MPWPARVTDGTRTPAEEIGDDATAEMGVRAREELLTTCATTLSYGAGAAMLFLQPWTWTAEAWFGGTAFVLAVVAAAVWQFGTGRGRDSRAEVLVAEYAVLRCADPGIGRRAAADATAKGFVVGRFIGWVVTLGMVAWPLALGQWDRPAWAVPGAALLGVTAAVQLTAREREARAGRRWLADPPGPPRD